MVQCVCSQQNDRPGYACVYQNLVQKLEMMCFGQISIYSTTPRLYDFYTKRLQQPAPGRVLRLSADKANNQQ
ncbi:hypothetical protein, partial [Methylobacter luteus]|uniref:hypothetical protein n=1 Tax=Methylobacter luteus TaxID=415 RepID=UPI00055C4484